VSVIFSTSVAQAILAPVLREFRESYPTVSLVVSLEDSPKAVREVEEGRADLALVVEDKLPGGLKMHPLFHDRLHLIFSPLHPWAKERNRSGRSEERALPALPAEQRYFSKS
jgi:DNA-binding transcriptional LysR family regulator